MASNEMSSLLVSEKLDGSNYANWKCEMGLILQMKNLWEVVTEAKPIDENELNKWNKKDMNACATLLWQISPRIRPHVQSLKTTKEIWQTLQTMYERTSKLKWILRGN